jgi:hypothetical protein
LQESLTLTLGNGMELFSKSGEKDISQSCCAGECCRKWEQFFRQPNHHHQKPSELQLSTQFRPINMVTARSSASENSARGAYHHLVQIMEILTISIIFLASLSLSLCVKF